MASKTKAPSPSQSDSAVPSDREDIVVPDVADTPSPSDRSQSNKPGTVATFSGAVLRLT